MSRLFLIPILLSIFLELGLPQTASAQQDIVGDSGVINLNNVCHPSGVGQDDGCALESFAVIYHDTTTTNLHTLSQTSVTVDSFDDGFNAFVCTNITQDGVTIAGPACLGDNGQGVAGLIGNIPINVSGGSHAYTVNTSSYYDFFADGGCESGGTCLFIVNTVANATLGPPHINSVSPPYVFVGTSGTLTFNGSSFVNPFGGNPTTISTTKSGGTGFTVTTGSVGPTQATASYSASLTATTGPWSLSMSYFLGSTDLVGVFGSFTVGDPTPSISSVSPSAWTAGQTNIPITIIGSGFGSNPLVTVVGSGIILTVTSHTDTGGPGAARVTANVSVNLCAPAQTASIIVKSNGYNGSGFTPAFAGQSSSGSSSATVTPIAAPAPTISFAGKNVTGATTNVVVGQQISLSGAIPSPQSSCLASQTWSQPPGTAVGGATAATSGGFTLASLPTNTQPTFGPYFWVYPGTFRMTFGYTLTNGVASSNAATTFTVKGGGSMTNLSESGGKLTVDNLTGCTAQPGGPYLVYGNVTGPAPGCTGTTSGSAGIVFTPSGAQSGGSYSYVQLIATDTSVYKTATTTLTCTTNPGVDKSYPYKGIRPGTSPPKATDAPEIPLPTTYTTATHTWDAKMYLLWKSNTANSITVPLGLQRWQFNGTTTQSGGKWGTPTGSGGPTGSFVPSAGGQANKGYPLWTNVATQNACK